MPERAGWWAYLKAAFAHAWPLGRLGRPQVVPLWLLAGGLAAVWALFAGRPVIAAAAAAACLGLAAVWVLALAGSAGFRERVDLRVAAQRREESLRAQMAEADDLSERSRRRYADMLAVCEQIERLLGQREHSGSSLGDVLKTGGLTELQAIFLRLLEYRDSLQRFLATPTARLLPAQIDTLRGELREKGIADAVRRSREQTLAILEQRQDNLELMRQSLDLAEAELERIEQQLALLSEQALVTSDMVQMAGQIDNVVEGIAETSAWLLDSERMLQSPDELERLSADAD